MVATLQAKSRFGIGGWREIAAVKNGLGLTSSDTPSSCATRSIGTSSLHIASNKTVFADNKSSEKVIPSRKRSLRATGFRKYPNSPITSLRFRPDGDKVPRTISSWFV